MHKLLDYICSELDDIERKVERGDSLTMNEVQYMDTLLHAKKNLLKSEQMEEDEPREYRARGRRRDSMGRYTRHSGDTMTDQLRDMMDDAPDEGTRKELQRFIDKIERR